MPVNSFENYPMSWKPILQRNKKALYLALAEELENDIHAADCAPVRSCRPKGSLRIFWISTSVPSRVHSGFAPTRDY